MTDSFHTGFLDRTKMDVMSSDVKAGLAIEVPFYY